MKDTYVTPDMEIICFQAEEILSTSNNQEVPLPEIPVE